MQAIIAFYNKNNKNNKFSINNSDFLDNSKFFVNFSKFYSNNNFLKDYFGNGNIKMANTNNTKILYLFFAFNSNSFSDISIINQCNRIIYVADVVCKAEFVLFANVFVAQLYNFSNLKINRLYIIQSIIYKLKLEKTQNLLQKNKKLLFYITKYMYNLVNKEILFIRKF